MGAETRRSSSADRDPPLEKRRDLAFGEDGHRSAAAPQAFAAIRNAVLGSLRLLGVSSIAAQLRASRRDPYRLPLKLLGLAALTPSPG
jgi:hypothetical protein